MALTPPKRRYRARPLLKGHPATAQLWRRYLTARKPLARRPGLFGRAMASWKLFLITEAYNDPMAIVLILAHQEILNLLLGTGKASAKHVPKMLVEPLAYWQGRVQSNVISRISEGVTRTPQESEEKSSDNKGNTLRLHRDAQKMIVGILMHRPDGKILSISKGLKASTHTHKKDLSR